MSFLFTGTPRCLSQEAFSRFHGRAGAVEEHYAQRLRVVSVTNPEDAEVMAELARKTFGLSPADPTISPRLLLAAQHNGGAVIGAWTDDQLAGFVFGYCGHAPEVGFYHYSQVAVVDLAFQGTGVGRLLKYAQAEHARAQGLSMMRWYFDPLRARNGHFNLNVLGSVADTVQENLFGVERRGHDAGYPSHRLVISWDLTQERPPAPSPVPKHTITIPRDWDAYRARQSASACHELANKVYGELRTALSSGLRIVALQRLHTDWPEYVLI
jgi:predicted GNAT superfamily acetyltransferase